MRIATGNPVFGKLHVWLIVQVMYQAPILVPTVIETRLDENEVDCYFAEVICWSDS